MLWKYWLVYWLSPSEIGFPIEMSDAMIVTFIYTCLSNTIQTQYRLQYMCLYTPYLWSPICMSFTTTQESFINAKLKLAGTYEIKEWLI